MSRNTRTYSDLDAAFTMNPRTRDVANKLDDNAIRGALKNLIHTRHYERPFNPNLGCQIHDLLFEMNDQMTMFIAERAIQDSIQKFEPRITVLDIRVTSTEDNEMYIELTYKIKNSEQISVFRTTFTRLR